MRSIPPVQDISRSREDIFLPIIFPDITAAMPMIKVRTAVQAGDIPESPQLIPVAAQSSELAAAIAAASAADSVFEPSMSAAVSSRYNRKTMFSLPARNRSSPLSLRRRSIFLAKLLDTVKTPIDNSISAPALLHIPGLMYLLRNDEAYSDIPSIPLHIRFITAAELTGSFIPSLLHDTANNSISILTIIDIIIS